MDRHLSTDRPSATDGKNTQTDSETSKQWRRLDALAYFLFS